MTVIRTAVVCVYNSFIIMYIQDEEPHIFLLNASPRAATFILCTVRISFRKNFRMYVFVLNTILGLSQWEVLPQLCLDPLRTS